MQSRTVEGTPAPTAAPGLPVPQATTVSTSQLGSSPRASYLAMRERREVLSDQMGRLLDRRNSVAERLSSPAVAPATKVALEQHMQEINTRIIDMEKKLHASDAEVAAAAGVPGARVPEPRPSNGGPGDDAWVAGAVFGGIAVVIVAIAHARRLWRGVPTVLAQIPAAFEARFTRFEQSIDAMAIEIERVSEGQRFLTRVLSEQTARAVGAGEAQPVVNRAGVAEPVAVADARRRRA